METATTTATQWFNNAGVITGLFTLGGAFLAFLAGLLSGWIQFKSNKELNTDQRLFDARRQAYERAISVFTFAQHKRRNGQIYPPSPNSPESQELNNILGVLHLYNPKTMSPSLVELFRYMASPIPPANSIQFKENMEYGVQIIQEILTEMRESLGTGPYLDDTVSSNSSNNVVTTPQVDNFSELIFRISRFFFNLLK